MSEFYTQVLPCQRIMGHQNCYEQFNMNNSIRACLKLTVRKIKMSSKLQDSLLDSLLWVSFFFSTSFLQLQEIRGTYGFSTRNFSSKYLIDILAYCASITFKFIRFKIDEQKLMNDNKHFCMGTALFMRLKNPRFLRLCSSARQFNEF